MHLPSTFSILVFMCNFSTNFLIFISSVSFDKFFNSFCLLLDETDGLISQALLTGNISLAVELCIKDSRWADALVLAQAGGLQLLQKTQKLYFQSVSTHSSKVGSYFKF